MKIRENKETKIKVDILYDNILEQGRAENKVWNIEIKHTKRKAYTSMCMPFYWMLNGNIYVN